MTNTILDLVSVTKQEGKFGVEVEVETNNDSSVLFSKVSSDLLLTHDDSLRSNYPFEAIFRNPKNLVDAIETVEKLYDLFEETNIEILDTGRSGTHVHVNVQNFTVDQVLTFAFYWYLIEPILIEYSGSVRKNSMFAVPFSESQESIEHVAMNYPLANPFYALEESLYKYSSLNFCPINRFGSIETRIWSNKKEHIITALNVLDYLTDYSLSCTNLLTISEDFSMKTPIGFAAEAIGPEFENIMSSIGNVNLSQKLRHNFNMLQPVLRQVINLQRSKESDKKKKR